MLLKAALIDSFKSLSISFSELLIFSELTFKLFNSTLSNFFVYSIKDLSPYNSTFVKISSTTSFTESRL